MSGAQPVPGAETAERLGSEMVGPRRVAFVVNTDRGFLTHRAVWAIALKASGSHVRVFAPDTGYGAQIRSLGLEFCPIDIGRDAISPVAAGRAAVKLFVALVSFRPNLVFLVQTAAYVLGWPASLVLRRTVFVRVAGGAGRALQQVGTRSFKMVALSLRLAARRKNVRTLFQLEGDRDRFVASGFAVAERAAVVPGTGIDTNAWRPSSTPPGQVTVLFVSRLYDEKGVREFVQIARSLRSSGARFVIVGEPDTGVSTAIPLTELNEWVNEGAIEWWGHRDDMISVFQLGSLLVFPSRHPEGTPKTLIEAAACGIPAIASNQEGCRTVVQDRVSGWIYDAEDVASMTSCVQDLINSPETLAQASSAAREHALNNFSLDGVFQSVLLASGLEMRPLEGMETMSSTNEAKKNKAEATQ